MTEKHCKYIIDWLSFSILDESTPFDAINLLGMPGISEIQWQSLGGFNFYRDRYYYGGISIHYNGKHDNMGIFVELSGEGCRTFETFGHGYWQDLFSLVNKQYINFTRLDLAFDDHEGLLDIDRLFVDTLYENFTSQYFTHQHIGGTLGKSIQHGRKESKTMIRIYDKAKERNREDEGHWIRAEIQLRHETAQNAVKLLQSREDSVSEVFLGAICGKLRYLQKPRKSTDTNKSRWNTATYWENFLKGAEKIKLTENVGIEYNLSKAENYLFNQAGGTLKALIEIHGADYIIMKMKQHEYKNPKYQVLVDMNQKSPYKNQVKRDPKKTREERENRIYEQQELEAIREERQELS